MPGAADTSIEQEADQAQLGIVIDRLRVARYGINVGDVQDVIDLALGGAPITGVFEGDRRFDVVARFAPEARANPAAIGALLIPTRDGARVPLAQLADIRTSDGASIIARRENQRAIAVRTNIRGRDQGGFVAEAQARLADAVKLPPGYSVDWGGQFENFARARARLTLIMPITLGVIFILLFVAFGTALDAGLVLVTVPLSLAGGVVALYVRGMNLNVSAAVGFISLFGVAVMSGVLYISEMNRRRRLARRVAARGRHRGRARAVAARAHGRRRGGARHGPGHAGARHRVGHPAPTGHGRGWRPDVDADPDTPGAARRLLAGRAAGLAAGAQRSDRLYRGTLTAREGGYR